MSIRSEHTGVVVAIDDPLMKGRLSVECPTIVAGDVLEWCDPEFEFTDTIGRAGAFFIPNVGSQVTVTIDDEEDSEVMGLNPRWKCTLYPTDTIPEVFLTNYPQRRGWVTSAGHILYFDDTDDELTFYYKHPSGTELTVNNNGEIHIGTGATEAIPLGDTLQTLLSGMKTAYDTHTHPDPVSGNTGVPSAAFPTVDDSMKSSKHKVES